MSFLSFGVIDAPSDLDRAAHLHIRCLFLNQMVKFAWHKPGEIFEICIWDAADGFPTRSYFTNFDSANTYLDWLEFVEEVNS